jgi:hypothetical protein
MSEQPISHAFVLPDENFHGWLAALQPYLNHFERVAVVRSPAGNDLNRFRNVSAVTAARTWVDDDPLLHIRRVYPQVVRVDVIEATTPAELSRVAAERVRRDDRYDEQHNTPPHLFDRFVIAWPTDYRPLQITRPFTTRPDDTPDPNPGIDIATEPGSQVLAGVEGTVTRQWAGTQPDDLNLGKYVQVTTERGPNTYILTYAGLRSVAVPLHSRVSVGDVLGEAGGDSIKLIVQQPGGAGGYSLPDIMNPMPMMYVTNLHVRPTVEGLRVRTIPGSEGEIIGQINPWDRLLSKEMHARTILKTSTDADANEWLHLQTPSGESAYSAAWLLEAVVRERDGLTGVNPVGVNLDQLHAQGTPDPSRLGRMGWVRFAYNVSNASGSEDIAAAYERYAPLAERYTQAGLRVMFVVTHQTYGEGQDMFWPWPDMTDAKWSQLIDRFAEMMGRIARQWAGSGLMHAWQIWNEQDAPIGAAASVSMSQENYAAMLSRVIPAIRSADAQSYVITGGFTGGPTRGGDYARYCVNNLPDGVQVDGIAFHPYGRGPNVASPYASFGHIDESINTYGAILPGQPLWITEWGVLNQPHASPNDIANYALDFITYVRARYGERVACMLWYAWAQGMHNGYGLVDAHGQPRPPLTERFLQA